MINLNEPPTETEIRQAKELALQLGDPGADDPVDMEIGGKSISISMKVVRPLIEVLGKMAEGKSVAIFALDDEVSPQEAAKLLNVSRPFATRLFDEGAIPSRKVGTHRRALVSDVLTYKQREKEARLKVLDELAAEGQRLNMGY